jgi:hypothetical protein
MERINSLDKDKNLVHRPNAGFLSPYFALITVCVFSCGSVELLRPWREVGVGGFSFSILFLLFLHFLFVI